MEKDIELLENLCEVFRMTQRSIDKYKRENYGEIIGQDEIQAIENLIARNKELEYKLRVHISIEAHEQVKQLYIPKSKVRELYEHYKDTGYYELESVLEELLQEGDK